MIINGTGAASLERIRLILQRDRIRAAGRAVLRRSTSGNRIVFYLNKQVAYVSHISFSEREGESPLGPISVVIETENPDHVIDWLTGQLEEPRERRPRQR